MNEKIKCANCEIVNKLEYQLKAARQECEELKTRNLALQTIEILESKNLKQRYDDLESKYDKLKKFSSNYATAVSKRNLKLDKIIKKLWCQ